MANPFADYSNVLRTLEQRLLVADLKDILKELHMSTSGNKRPLIERLSHHLKMYKDANDIPRYTQLRSKIMGARATGVPNVDSHPVYRPPASSIPVPPRPAPFAPPNHYQNFKNPPYYHPPPQQLVFRESPFYSIKDRISNPAALPIMSRNNVVVSFVLTSTALDLLTRDPAHHKVALMSGDTAAYGRPLLMEFPSPAELSVNGQRLTTNLKGMKNKPGTVPPVDLTTKISLVPRLANRIDLAYSSGTDHKKFQMQVVLLQTSSVDELIERVKNGKRFTKESVLQKLRKPDDDDIELASYDMSLKDPLSYMRITVPCRTTFCKHQQCFDARSFLTINEQTPQWTCPICHLQVQNLDALAVDGYFEDILASVGPDVDAVLVDPQGNWRIAGEENGTAEVKEEQREPAMVLDLDETEDEDDTAAKTITPTVSSIPSRLQTESRPATPSKRKAMPVCIDLTEDSDEDDIPLKKIKQSDSMELQTPRLPEQPSVPTSAHAYLDKRPPRLASTLDDAPASNWPATLKQFGSVPSSTDLILPQIRDKAPTTSDARPSLEPGEIRQENYSPDDVSINFEEFEALYNAEHGRQPVLPAQPIDSTQESRPPDPFPFGSDDVSEADGSAY